MTRDEAKQVALDDVRAGNPNLKEEIVVMDDATEEKTYGWVFHYTSRRYLETRNPLHGLAGGGPIVVEHSGRVTRLGSRQSPDRAIAEFERGRGHS
jgi:Immunity protein 35